MEDNNKKIFRDWSGFLPFARTRKTSILMRLRLAKWFKTITRSRMSQLTQMCTNHAPTGEYFKNYVWKYREKPDSFFQCPCKHTSDYPPTLQTRNHIIRACPLFKEAWERLSIWVPWIRLPRWSISRLLKKKAIDHTLEYLKAGLFSRKHAPYEPLWSILLASWQRIVCHVVL